MTQIETPREMIVDSHHHFWDVGKLDYPWMPPGEGVLRRNYLPADLAPILERNGVSRTVLVQANQSPEEAGFLLDLAEATDFVAGVVVWVDLTSPDVAKVLDELGRRPKLVGVRHQVHDEPDDAWLSRDDVVRGLRELGRRGLTYDLLLRPQHIKYVPALAERVPDLRLVVDHIAKPLIAGGVMEPWATDMASVAAIPGLYCKVSGMVTEADHSRWTADDLKPYVSHVVELFGYSRLMWGSDWPACLPAATYDQVLQAALDAVGPIPDDDSARLMGRNATDFYRL
jgi:L-fuconolactonase